MTQFFFMKKILIPALLFLCTSSFAQKGKEPYPSVYELLKSNGIPGKIAFQFPMVANIAQAKNEQAKIIILPIDNMPCLVPDVREFNMPVLKLSILGKPTR